MGQMFKPSKSVKLTLMAVNPELKHDGRGSMVPQRYNLTELFLMLLTSNKCKHVEVSSPIIVILTINTIQCELTD